jgi:hypothetical protein
VDTAWKTPPLQDTDVIQIPIDIHPTAPNPLWAGWAGALMDVHILDATELDIFGIRNPTGITYPDPFGPASANTQSVVKTFTFWHPNGLASGIPLTPSVNQPIFTITVHAKNTSPIYQNSDVDIDLSFWNIWHVGSGPGSTPVPLPASALVWVTSNVDTLHTVGSEYQFPLEPAQPGDPNAHWLHLVNTITVHLAGGPGSTFYATKLNNATIGIEHVPEPATGLLVGFGLAAVALSRRFAARRKGLL